MTLLPLRLALLLLLSATLVAQSPDVVKPGDNLLAEGIPPIPASLAETVTRYTEFRSAALASWHPTRREMLITTRFGDTNQVHAVKMPGGARTQLTFFPDRVSAAAYPPRGEGSFVFSKDVGGDEWFQIYRYDVATGDVTLLTDGKSRNQLGPWSNGGRPPRLHVHAPHRPRQRPLHRQPGRSQIGPPAGRSAGAAAGSRRTGRPTTGSCWWRSTSRSTRATSGWST